MKRSILIAHLYKLLFSKGQLEVFFVFLFFASCSKETLGWVKQSRTAAIMKLVLNLPSTVVSSALLEIQACGYVSCGLRQNEMERLWCGTLLSFIESLFINRKIGNSIISELFVNVDLAISFSLFHSFCCCFYIFKFSFNSLFYTILVILILLFKFLIESFHLIFKNLAEHSCCPFPYSYCIWGWCQVS